MKTSKYLLTVATVASFISNIEIAEGASPATPNAVLPRTDAVATSEAPDPMSPIIQVNTNSKINKTTGSCLIADCYLTKEMFNEALKRLVEVTNQKKDIMPSLWIRDCALDNEAAETLALLIARDTTKILNLVSFQQLDVTSATALISCQLKKLTIQEAYISKDKMKKIIAAIEEPTCVLNTLTLCGDPLRKHWPSEYEQYEDRNMLITTKEEAEQLNNALYKNKSLKRVDVLSTCMDDYAYELEKGIVVYGRINPEESESLRKQLIATCHSKEIEGTIDSELIPTPVDISSSPTLENSESTPEDKNTVIVSSGNHSPQELEKLLDGKYKLRIKNSKLSPSVGFFLGNLIQSEKLESLELEQVEMSSTEVGEIIRRIGQKPTKPSNYERHALQELIIHGCPRYPLMTDTQAEELTKKLKFRTLKHIDVKNTSISKLKQKELLEACQNWGLTGSIEGKLIETTETTRQVAAVPQVRPATLPPNNVQPANKSMHFNGILRL